MLHKKFLMSALGMAVALNLPLGAEEFRLRDSFKTASSPSGISSPFFVFSGPVSIEDSGVYFIDEPLYFDPINPDEACISVLVDNVTIDLNSNSISQLTGNDQANTIGIYIAPGVQNVTIRNGSIGAFTGIGIFADTGVTGLKVFNVTLDHMGIGGVAVGAGSSTISLSDVSVQHTINEETDAVYGFYFDTVNSIEIQNCSISNNNATANNSYGMLFNACNDVHIKDSLARESSADGLESIGFNFISCSAVTVERSEAVANSGINSNTASRVVGFELNSCSFVSLIDCRALDNTSLFGSAYGIFAYDGSNNRIVSSQSIGNGGNEDSFGIVLGGTEATTILEDSSIIANSSSSGTTYGLFVDATSEDSWIQRNSIRNHTSGVSAYGIFDDSGSLTTNEYLSNYLLNNTTNINFSSVDVPVFSGPLTSNPSIFENVLF